MTQACALVMAGGTGGHIFPGLAVAEALREWERSVKPHGIDYVLLDTSLPMSRPLRAYLRKREKLG